MKIIVIGAGDVGQYLCQTMSEDGHFVTLIESDEERADEIESNLDVRLIRGNGASTNVLTKAGISGADFLMAMTDNDQLNIVACSLGRKLGAKVVVARVHDQTYNDNLLVNYQRHFNIDILINPEALTAMELAKQVRNPERMAMEEFARGQVELQEIQISREARVIGKTLRELNLGPGIKIGYVKRKGGLEVPTANTILSEGDKVTVIGTPEILLKNRYLFSNESSSTPIRVVLNGATETTISLIRRLNGYRFKLRVIEPDLKKCKDLAERFPNVTVINGSATSLRLMEEEQIGCADYFISCTKDDEENVMTCLQARKLGAKNVELVVNKPDYEQVIQNISGFLNFADAASPRRVTVSEIKKYVTDKNFTIVGSLKGGTIVFLELKVSPKSRAADKKVRDLSLPTACIIAAIVDDAGAKVPGAQDTIKAGDRLIIILGKEMVKEVANFFA